MALKENFSDSDDEFILENIGAETRSGCRIEKVKTIESKHETIFKEGKEKKLLEEKESLELWQNLFPGLTPRIFGFDRRGENASLLLEYIDGKNFQEILLSSDMDSLKSITEKVFAKVEFVWNSTKQPEKSSVDFIGQLEKRLKDVYAVHPHFKGKTKVIGTMEKPDLETMLKKCKEIEKDLYCPFSVLIHGDFNNDNIIYNPYNQEVYYIDIHRSKHTDYVQDVSVFLVSNFRMPVFNSEVRKRINYVNTQLLDFAKDFALRNNDTTFDARLALGLARSFLTSTRFALKKWFASKMYLRAIYLLERITENEGNDWSEFHLTKDIFID